MCGINGYNFKDENLIKKMMFHTRNRGPDARKFISREDITLGHDRLSILDLNERSNQPFIFKNLILSFNGEIYNYIDLKNHLQKLGYNFKTTSDTEVVIYMFHKYGIESFRKLSGIFAISLWDENSKTLYLIRDIVGVKPLYYFYDESKNFIYFSSSIKSLLINKKAKILNQDALFSYQNIGRNDFRETFFKDIYKLLPGQLIIQKKNKKIKLLNFLNFSFKKNISGEPKKKIFEIIKSQFISDVPIALSLSGGYDSNIIYYVMRNSLEKKKYRLYSFFFPDYEKFNSDYRIADKNSKFFNDQIEKIEVNHKDFINNVDAVSEILEEPISNQSSMLNFVMAKNVKEKILMTGDGGDEIFGGYDHYRSAYILSSLAKINPFKFFIKKKFKNKNIQRLFFKNSKEFFISFNEGNLMKNKNLYFKNFKELNVENLFLNHSKNFSFSNRLNDLCYLDIDTKIPNDFLRRNDNIFMNFGIETRVPYLDQNMIESFIFMNEKKKFNYLLTNKGFLKKNFNKKFLTVKKKWGLQSPIAKWMKKELQPFLKEILSEQYYSNSSEYLNFKEIEKLLILHKEKYYNPDLIWSLVVFQIFLRKFNL